MTSAKNCPQCGAPLQESAPGGLCPRCVVALTFKTETVFTDEPAAMAAPPTPAELAPHFPQLEILECLGRGGMGVVYKVRQPQLDRIVALKILAPERVTDAHFADRFLREARALAKLNHPNIVTIHDFGQTGGYFYLLMELVDGVNLRELLRGGRMSPREALAIVPAICEALQYAHDRGIIHRDIKPENIILDKQGRVKIADFGIARILRDPAVDETAAEPPAGAAPGLTAESVLGTPKYMAPEQAEKSGAADHRADIYSLGVVFYEMLTGELPGKNLEPPSRKVHIDVRLDEIVLRALERKPELRYQQASVLQTQVETIADTPPGASPPASERQNKPIAYVALCCAVMSGILGGVTFFLMPYPSQLLIWSILVAALLGVFLGIRARKMPLGRRAIGVGCINTAIWLAFAAFFPEPGGNANLADSPWKLRLLPTVAVIRVGMAKPQLPWAWQELQNRAQDGRLNAMEADKIVDDVAAWLRRDYPHGYEEPLNWLNILLEELDRRHLVGETNAMALVEAHLGMPTLEPLPRLRENEQTLEFTCRLYSPWDDRLFGLKLLNELHALSIDGRPVSAHDSFGRHWDQQQYVGELQFLNLAPGKHTLRCEFESALVAITNMPGLPTDALSKDWPPARRIWTRACQTEFVVYPEDAQLVSLAEDPALDPVASGAVSLGQVIIRPKHGNLTAVISFDVHPKPRAPISVDVTLRLAGQAFKCGTLWAGKEAGGQTAMSGWELTADIGPLDPQIKEADILLTPNPKAVEFRPGVDRIWGKDIVISHIPLSRQDLNQESKK